MYYLELSLKDVEIQSRKLAKSISKTFRPDIVIFIAQGSFPIGMELSKCFNVPLYEIYAERQGGRLKNIISPVLRIVPKRLKYFLRKGELKSGVHKKSSNRKVYMEYDIKNNIGIKNILIVDDSVDTGHTAKEVYNFVQNKFPSSTIRFAAFNCFSDSKQVFNVDFHLYENHILIGPWSKDSKEYHMFKNYYNKWKKG